VSTMPTIRIDDDVMRFLQAKAEAFVDSPNDVLRRELGIDKLSAKPGRAPIVMPNRRGYGPDKDYTHHSLRGFSFNGQFCPCNSFKDLLIKFCVALRNKHKGDFDKLALTLHGTKRPYFSLDPSRLKYPELVPGTLVSAETNLNANLIVGICQKLAAGLGYGSADLVID
jgi:negative regulator of replication initiation